MMTVEEYAIDVNRSVKTILDKCAYLGFDVKDANTLLTEEQVIDLDNAEYEDEIDEELDDKVEVIVSNMKNVDDSVKMQKLKKKSELVMASDFKNKKKEMYKHKEKLISNAPNIEDNKIV